MPSSLTVKFHLDLTTSRKVQDAIDGVIDGVKNRVIKAAIAKVARLGAKEAKAKVPVGTTRFLKNSIGTRYRSYQRGLAWVYVIGPRKGMGGLGAGTPGPNGSINMRKYDPAKYAHLAERGRGPLVAKSGKVMAFFSVSKRRKTKSGVQPQGTRRITNAVYAQRVGPAKGQPFMAPAYKYVGSSAMRRMAIQDILAGIQREAAKYAAKGKSIYA